VLAKVGQCKKPNRVFQLGMQLFPLSDPYPPPQRRGRKRRIRGAEMQKGNVEESDLDVPDSDIANDSAAKECEHE